MSFKHLVLPLAAALALSVPSASIAKNDKQNKAYHANPAAAGCPPGLAKKSPSCVPPGQAKSQQVDNPYEYRVGRALEGDYVIVENPQRYGLDPSLAYARVGDMIVHIEPETLEVIAAVGVIDALMN